MHCSPVSPASSNHGYQSNRTRNLLLCKTLVFIMIAMSDDGNNVHGFMSSVGSNNGRYGIHISGSRGMNGISSVVSGKGGGRQVSNVCGRGCYFNRDSNHLLMPQYRRSERTQMFLWRNNNKAEEDGGDENDIEKNSIDAKVTMKHFEEAVKKVREQKDLKMGEKLVASYYR